MGERWVLNDDTHERDADYLIATLVRFRLNPGAAASRPGEEPPGVAQPRDTATAAPAATALI